MERTFVKQEARPAPEVGALGAPIDGRVLRRWALGCVAGLEKRCAEINDLNVYPIPDGDTGTNLLATMRSAVAGVDKYALDDAGRASRDVHQVAVALAKGAVYGARGNSGVILSQVLRGLAQAAGDVDFGAEALRNGLLQGSNLATDAVSDPVEGTIVTVLRCAADAAAALPRDADVAATAQAAADAAVSALMRTTSQLDVLEAAGVVDAGGFGLVVILDALVEAITGTAPERTLTTRRSPRTKMPAVATDTCAGDSGQDYEVMYLVSDSDDERMGNLRTSLDALGDSVVIVGDGHGGWSVHVHCTDAGAAVESGLAAGTVHGIRITNFLVDAKKQTTETPGVRVRPITRGRGIIAIAAGDGAAELFAAEGAIVLRGDTPVTRGQLLGVIRQMERSEVLVLPNGGLSAQELVAVSAAARDSSHEVVLLATSSMVQGIAALAVHDPRRDAVDDAFAMSEAAAATRWGALRLATERALTYVGTCELGDALGLMGQEVVVIDAEPTSAATRLVDLALGGGGELVTVILGAEAPEGIGEHISDHVAHTQTGVDVVVYFGGQAGDLLQLGIE
ncbi:MAG: DAK2 domain-containing protein [Rhodococcus sp.]|nr:DAK2 domain-containing protein [Rhodococcus sp. (in: high G+C Gram-positive bacteria)]